VVRKEGRREGRKEAAIYKGLGTAAVNNCRGENAFSHFHPNTQNKLRQL
jgi:hypothetical protein